MHDIQYFEGQPTDAERASVGLLYPVIFGQDNLIKKLTRLEGKEDILLLLVYDDERPIGFKLGFRWDEPGTYYSWLGGVLPEYRGQGIAARLMDIQHDWCLRKGYQKVRTHTLNQWRSMLLLNIKMGFDIAGIIEEEGAPLKIVLEKTLVQS